MNNKKKMAIICSTDYKSYPMGGMMSFVLDVLPGLYSDFDITNRLLPVYSNQKMNKYIKEINYHEVKNE